MKLESLNVGKPKEVNYNGKTVLTGIFKYPVNRKLKLSFTNLEDDGQADLKNHGGADKAVYAYAQEHYSYWRQELPEKELEPGIFGENLTISGGLFESEIQIGDVFSLGSAEIMVVQPRYPCFKLGVRFCDPLIVKKFLQSGRPGIYFRVIKEGEVKPGDRLIKVKAAQSEMSVSEIFELLVNRNNKEMLEKAINTEHLAESLKEHFQTFILAL